MTKMGLGDYILVGILILGAIWYFAPDTFNDMKDNTLTFISDAAKDAVSNKIDDTLNRTSEVDLDFEGLAVANWNLQVFGQSKASDEELMKFYTDVIDEFDIVFVQEIRDADEVAFPKLCGQLGQDYECLLSSRAGRTPSKEQIGIIYRSDIDIVESKDYNPDSEDRWERPPVVVTFETQGYEFTVYDIHIKPTDAPQEIAYLEDIVDVNGNNIIMGDLNADCTYYDNDAEDDFVGWNWIVGDDDVTNIAATGCAYDRIIMNEDAYNEYMSYGIYTQGIDAGVSDHYLVWVELNPVES